MPYVYEGAAERLFHNRVYVPAEDSRGLEALGRYMMRPPVSLSRLRFAPGSHEVVYSRKGGHDEPEQTEGERIDAMEFVARVLVQIPDPRRHSVRYYGFSSNAARGKRKKAAAPAEPPSPGEAPEGATPEGGDRVALRRRWAELIRRVYEVDPLVCPRCGGEMRVVGFITQPAVITHILDHLRKRERVSRPPRTMRPLAARPAGPRPRGSARPLSGSRPERPASTRKSKILSILSRPSGGQVSSRNRKLTYRSGSTRW